jgi:tRNA (guanine37-N1)-methyltransferase
VKRFDVITIFPEMLDALADHGITRRAMDEGRFELKAWDPRDFTQDSYRRVDDRPYGGGPGMVMMPGPLEACIEAAKARQKEAGVARPHVVLMSPQGERLGEELVHELFGHEGLVVVAGRYEGIDERLVERVVDREVSIGDYVTSGGELPAMVMIDCIVRRLPGSLNDAESASQDSFSAGFLDWPHYTRPEEWKGVKVPEVLLSGNHAAIARWRRKQALLRTRARRPDLFAKLELDAADLDALRAAEKDGGG